MTQIAIDRLLLPEIPETDRGQVVIARLEQVGLMPSAPTNSMYS